MDVSLGLRKYVSFANREILAVIGILLCSLVVRFILFFVQGDEHDLTVFAGWFRIAADFGPRFFYDVTWSDYPPVNVYIFWGFGSLSKQFSLFGTSSLVYLVKLPATLFDILISFVIFVFLRKKLDFKPSIITASIYAFNPAIIFNTSVWGQYDAIYTFFLILSFITILDSKPKLSAIALTLAILTKPQSIALTPLIVFLIVRNGKWKNIITLAFISIITFLVVMLPLNWNNNLFDLLARIYFGGYANYAYTSVNAFNVWAFDGFWKSDARGVFFLDFFKIGWSMFGALTLGTLYLIKKRKMISQDALFFSAFVLLFGFFMLPTRIHERYMFPAFSFLVLSLPFFRKIRLVYGILTLTYLANLAYVMPFLNNGNFIQDWDPFVLVVTLTNIAIFIFILLFMVKETRVNFDKKNA